MAREDPPPPGCDVELFEVKAVLRQSRRAMEKALKSQYSSGINRMRKRCELYNNSSAKEATYALIVGKFVMSYTLTMNSDLSNTDTVEEI